MKAPKCQPCGGRHWSTQPCPASNTASNKEKVHLTASNRTRSRAEGAEDGDGLPPVMPGRSGTANPSAPPRVLKQRWSRVDYNAYMKDYMRRRREHLS